MIEDIKNIQQNLTIRAECDDCGEMECGDLMMESSWSFSQRLYEAGWRHYARLSLLLCPTCINRRDV